ncbi:peptidoglycan -binding protein [Roseomonas aerophila]|uniref:Peptidoglycan -binding protein n=1 Tax=Teichococcus aerophilus TaxID=1224513 RepID=A0ABR7RR57_9PROT|nr:peptidoglycan -binding protein [Pseudoroseomonas aerophila]MBC9208831.1 peptidoglycan -binding protein [Pseudoroseomonas aerophila]
MALRRGGNREGLNAWPGYVDALSTLLMVLIFVLLVFVLAQGFLSVALSSRDQALDRLNRQVSELADLLALERGQGEELRGRLGRMTEELRAATGARDSALAQLGTLRDQQERQGTERDTLRADRDRLAARLADLEASSRGAAGRIASLEERLADALSRAEARGGDAAASVRDLTETRRALATERDALATARQQLAEQQARAGSAEGQRDRVTADLATARAELDRSRQALEAMRQQMAALDRQVTTDRATIEARLSDITRLNEQVRALTALRDEMERRAQAALDRAGSQEQARTAAEVQARTEAERRAAAEAQARAEAEGRGTAEAATGEQTRLAESARAQVALLTQQITALRAELSRIAAVLEAEENAGRDKDAQISALGQRLNAALAARVEELQRYRSDFFGRLRDVLGDRPEVRIVGDRFVFQSEVLFPVGSADLSASGTQQLRELSRVLLDVSRRFPADLPWLLRVDGHADRSPLRGTGRYASNWELSSARAIAVAQVLISEGLPANRVGATAFGDNQPLDPGDSPEALARNRRIELRLTDR